MKQNYATFYRFFQFRKRKPHKSQKTQKVREFLKLAIYVFRNVSNTSLEV
jgi:hypothetical protein